MIDLPFANEAIQFRVNMIYSLACPTSKHKTKEEKKETQPI